MSSEEAGRRTGRRCCTVSQLQRVALLSCSKKINDLCIMPTCIANKLSHWQVGRLCNDFTAYRPNSVPTPARLLQLMRSRALGVASLSSRSEVPGRGPPPCKSLAGARITTPGEKGRVPIRRTAHFLARADKQSMDNSAFIPSAKQDKQASLSGKTSCHNSQKGLQPLTTFLRLTDTDTDTANNIDIVASGLHTCADRR